MGMIWLPVCCASSIAFRKFTQINELLNSEMSISLANEVKQSQHFIAAVENQDRITSSQILKIIENSRNADHLKDDFSNVGLKRSSVFSAFVKNVSNFYAVAAKFSNVYKYSIRFKPLNPLYFTLILTFIVAANVSQMKLSYRTIVIISYYAIYTYFFHALQMFFYRKVKNWFFLANLCDFLNILALTATGYFLHTNYDFFSAFRSSMNTTYITVILLYSFLYLFGHISQSVGITYSQHKKILESYFNSDSFKLNLLNQELVSDGLKWKQFIHGKLQSKILSNAVKTKSGSDNQASSDYLFVGEIKNLITHSLDIAPENRSNPTQIIEQVSKPWGAVIDIQSEIDQSIAKQKLSPSATQTVTDVLEEAITNAVKHGGAEKVWLIAKSKSSNTLKLEVRNDGAPMGKAKRQSAGTKLFNHSGLWSISNENGLVVFKIQIAI